MKTYKSFTCKISGNINKVNFLNEQLDVINDLSWFVFTLGTKYSISWWKDQKKLYHHCRLFFPEINSRILQNFISQYQPKGKRTVPKHKIIEPAIYLAQCNNLVFKITNNTKITNYWLRFSKRNFPLFGKNSLVRLKNPKNVKLVQIFRKNEILYCKFSYLNEIEIKNNSDKEIYFKVMDK